MFLDLFDKELQKATVSNTPSYFPHGIFRLPLYRFSWNFKSGTFTKTDL